MEEDRALDILKNAILLEKRGRSFYGAIAEKTANDAVRRFFSQMADEESEHIRVLSEQFKAYLKTKKFNPTDPARRHSKAVASEVLNRELRQQIAAADFEAAAIAAAMAMEKNAVRLYAQRAEEAQDANEKELYTWLADWEKSHLAFLAAIDREVTENIWHDNAFWPF